MKKVLFICSFILFFGAIAQQSEEEQIRAILKSQQECWNDGDIDCFMQGYWKSDKLTFIGKSGITYGWRQTLENYKKTYPNRDAMGTLSFEIIEMELLSDSFWMVIGKWSLSRKNDKPSGHFTLLFRDFDGEWLIVSDHSS